MDSSLKARITKHAPAIRFEKDFFPLKKVCSHMEIAVLTLQRPLFCNDILYEQEKVDISHDQLQCSLTVNETE